MFTLAKLQHLMNKVNRPVSASDTKILITRNNTVQNIILFYTLTKREKKILDKFCYSKITNRMDNR